MYRFLLMATFLLALGACNYKDFISAGVDADDFKWAKVDENKIKQHVLSLLNDRHEYPLESIKVQDKLALQKKDNEEQLKKLTATAREKCLADKKTSSSDPASITVYEVGRAGSFLAAGSGRKCLASVNDDPLISDLNAAIKNISAELRAYSVARREHASEVSAKAKNITEQLIASYAANQYQLIIDSRAQELFNASGMSIDITTAVMNTIDIERLDPLL